MLISTLYIIYNPKRKGIQPTIAGTQEYLTMHFFCHSYVAWKMSSVFVCLLFIRGITGQI